MPVLKEDSTWEWHGVQCAGCKEKSEIKIKLGTLWKSSQFNKKHQYICKSCKKSKKGK
jgi:hypothetical protein